MLMIRSFASRPGCPGLGKTWERFAKRNQQSTKICHQKAVQGFFTSAQLLSCKWLCGFA